MSIDIRVPALPESVADATVLSWHNQPGEAVMRDENLVDLETDKVVLEVPAPSDGVLTEIQFNEGDTVEADQILAILDENGKAAAAAPAKAAPAPAATPETAPPESSGDDDDQPVLTPSVRRLVKERRLPQVNIVTGDILHGKSVLRLGPAEHSNRAFRRQIGSDLQPCIFGGVAMHRRVPVCRDLQFRQSEFHADPAIAQIDQGNVRGHAARQRAHRTHVLGRAKPKLRHKRAAPVVNFAGH